MIGAAVCGLFGVAVASLASLGKRELLQRLPIIAILILALGELALIWVGRSDYGLSFAASSRYVTLTNVGALAALVLIACRAAASPLFRVTFLAGCALVVTATVFADCSEIRTAEFRKSYQARLAKILDAGVIGDEELVALNSSKRAEVEQGLETLRKYRLNQFRKHH